MADTFGGLVDKLFTVDMKMWVNQELLYEIRRMKSVEEFKQKYQSDEGMEKLWGILQKACDLNVQRNHLIDELDEKVIEIVKAGISGENLDDGKFVQRKHKTY